MTAFLRALRAVGKATAAVWKAAAAAWRWFMKYSGTTMIIDSIEERRRRPWG